MEHAHHHHHHASGNIRSLSWALALTGGFLVVEIVGGLLTQSLALLSDAAHMMTDVMALVIAILAISIGKRPADARRTYGYRRFEILAAALNAVVLFLVALFILYEAYERFVTPPEIAPEGMMLVAALGLVVNLVCMRILAAGSTHSLNMKGAYLEVFADMLGSLAVLIGGGVIYLTGWARLDPILAVGIGFWVVPRTWGLFSESINILLEGVPKGVKLEALRTQLATLPGVVEVHALHVWAITSGQNSLTAHLRVAAYPEDDGLLQQARAVAAQHGIDHTNFQVELRACRDAGEHHGCVLAAESPHHHPHAAGE